MRSIANLAVWKIHHITEMWIQRMYSIAKISAIKFHTLETILTNKNQDSLYLLLDQVTDVRNFGAILRTAECTKVTAIIIPLSGSAPINADTIKTSAGAAFKIPIVKVNHLLDAIYELQAEDIQIVSITEKTDTYIYDLDFNKPTALVMGSEHKGISPSILKISDNKGKLPLLGDIESLNVSVACSVALYEVIRQRNFK